MKVEITREFYDRVTGEHRLPGDQVEYTNDRAMELYWGGWVIPAEEPKAAAAEEAPKAEAPKKPRKK